MHTANIPVNNIIPQNIILNTENKEVEPYDSIAIYEHQNGQVLTLNLVGTTPAHLRGWQLVQQRQFITMGISIGNGYFSRERLEVIIIGMASYFKEVLVIIPDLPTMHSYIALGYADFEAMSRVKKHRKDILRHYKKISEQAEQLLSKSNISFLQWNNEFFQKEIYQSAYNRAIEMYNQNGMFREAILRNTERYILARLEDRDVQQLGGIKKVVERSSGYLLEEMAFHEVCHLISNKPLLSSYYKEFELTTNYISGFYGNRRNVDAGFVVYNIINK